MPAQARSTHAVATSLPIRWTGHPFVDAGLAAMAAAVDVEALEKMTPEAVEKALRRLNRVLLSDQALGVGTQRSFARGALAFVFPNGELANPSHWRGKTPEEKAQNVRAKFASALAEDLSRALACLDARGSREVVCTTCGEARPEMAMIAVRKDQLPLAQGIVNFYPALSHGMEICGLCSLALRFLPLSVLDAGTYGGRRLWFIHSQMEDLVIRVSRLYGWLHFEDRIARNEPVDFYAFRTTAGGTAAILYVLFELLERFPQELGRAYLRPHSTTAYLFVNENREGYVHPIPIPQRLLTLLSKLQVLSKAAYERFWTELLAVPESLSEGDRRPRDRFVREVADRILAGEPILPLCLNHEKPALLGGWQGHRLYLEGMRSMPAHRLSVLERLGVALAESPEAKRWMHDLQDAHPGQVYGVLLDLVRQGFLSHQELYALTPPGEPGLAGEVRDVLLAVLYDATRCREQGEPFPSFPPEPLPPPDETLARLQSIGGQLARGLENLPRWIAHLQTARRPDQIRRVYLQAVQKGAMGFADFVFLCPLDQGERTWQLRDYLLAFLFEYARKASVALEVEETSVS